MTDELKRAIIKLKDRISESVHFHEDLNEASWCRQTGILITRNEANLIVCELERPLPTDEEIRNTANEIGEKEYWPIGRQTGFVFGAKWMRNLMRKEATE